MLVLDQTCKQIKSNWGCRTHLLPQCYRDNNQQEDKYIWGRSEQENTPTKTEMCSNRWHYKKNEEDSSPWNHECKQIHLIQFFFNYLCPANSISTTSPDMQSVSCIVCVISQELGFGFVCACVCVSVPSLPRTQWSGSLADEEVSQHELCVQRGCGSAEALADCCLKLAAR